MSCSMTSRLAPISSRRRSSTGAKRLDLALGDAAGRLVEQDHRRSVGDLAGEVDDATRAGRQLADERVAVRAEVHQLDQLVDALWRCAPRRRTPSASAALRPARCAASSIARARPPSSRAPSCRGTAGRPGSCDRDHVGARCRAESSVMSWPSRIDAAAVDGVYPLMRSNSVVLPAPFGPMMPTISPLPTENDTSSTARMPPNERTDRHDLQRRLDRSARSRPAVRRSAARAARRTDVGQEHRAQQVGTAQQLGSRPAEPDRAALHEVRPLGQRQRDVDALLDQDHRHAVVGQPTHDRQQLTDDHRREAQRQLVDQQHPRLGDEGHAERQHLLLPAAEVRRVRRIALAQHRERLEHLLGRRVDIVGSRRRVQPASRRFSPTVSEPNTPWPPGIWLMPSAAISLGGAWVMSRPSSTTAPRSASTTPLIAFSSVLLPAPLVPSRATISPSLMSMSTPNST